MEPTKTSFRPITQAEITSSELGAPLVVPALIGRRRTPRWSEQTAGPDAKEGYHFTYENARRAYERHRKHCSPPTKAHATREAPMRGQG